MAYISAKKIKKTYGPKLIFDNVSFEINNKDRIALVGRNGTGKSTIFKIITGNENYDSGELYVKKDLKIGYLEQEPDYGDKSVREVINLAKQEIFEINELISDIVERMTRETDSDILMKLSEKYDRLLNEYALCGGYEYESEVLKVISGLKIPESYLDIPFKQLSGGEKTRVLLAKLLLGKPDILLLDEPTNHLDLASREILEENLENFEGNLLIVSHDRYFVNKMASRLWVYNNESFQSIDGNYEYYRQNKERLLKKTNDPRQNAYPHNNNTSKKNVDQEECEREI